VTQGRPTKVGIKRLTFEHFLLEQVLRRFFKQGAIGHQNPNRCLVGRLNRISHFLINLARHLSAQRSASATRTV